MAEQLNIGLIGCGFFAQNHLHAWNDLKPEGAQLVAVCDIDPDKARVAGEKFGARWYTDATEMLDKEELGLVDIATQVRTQLALVEQTMARRLPSIVQDKLVQAFENSGQVGGVGRPGDGLAIDFKIITAIRAFEIKADRGERAVVELSVKVLNDRNGVVVATRVFSASTPVTHILLTDGLATVSVFAAENKLPAKVFRGVSSIGAVHAYGRMVDDHHVAVVGEVPARTVEQIGNSLRRTTDSP